MAVSLATIALAWWGVALAWRSGRRLDTLFVAGPVAVIALVHVFLYASPRYQVPLLPLLIVFAAVSLDRVQSATIKAPL